MSDGSEFARGWLDGVRTENIRIIEYLEQQRDEHFHRGEIGHADAIVQALKTVRDDEDD